MSGRIADMAPDELLAEVRRLQAIERKYNARSKYDAEVTRLQAEVEHLKALIEWGLYKLDHMVDSIDNGWDAVPVGIDIQREVGKTLRGEHSLVNKSIEKGHLPGPYNTEVEE